MTKIEICDRYNSGENVTIDEIKEVAFSYLDDLTREEENYCRDTLIRILEEHGEPWSGYNPDFPDNPYHTGYTLEGVIFATDYTGVLGVYWNSICKEVQ